MSSINRFPTFQYSQPEEYKFSHDSVFLAREVYERLESRDMTSWKALDVCAGCGVVGLDFLFHGKAEGKTPAEFDFIEVQDVYEKHFAENLKRLNIESVKTNFILQNYDVLQAPIYTNRYDLILSNPPYFNVRQGTLSPSDFKNRCRFFIDSDLGSLVKGIENSLVPGGQAYVLLRSLKAYGQDVFASVRGMLEASSLQCSFQIRGTDVALIQKNC